MEFTTDFELMLYYRDGIAEAREALARGDTGKVAEILDALMPSYSRGGRAHG